MLSIRDMSSKVSSIVLKGLKKASSVPILGVVFRPYPWYIEHMARNLKKPTDSFMGKYAMKWMVQKNSFLEKNAVKLCNIEPNHTVLEIGFGPGVGLSHAYNIVKGGKGKIYGIDSSWFALDMAEHNFHDQIFEETKMFVFQANVESIPLNTNTVDRVFHCNCYYFWPSMRKAMREIYRVMRPGSLMITTLDIKHLEKVKRKGFLKYGYTDPMKYMSCLENYGFENVRMEYKTDADTGQDFQVIFAEVLEKPDLSSLPEEEDDEETKKLKMMIAIEKKYGLLAEEDEINLKKFIEKQREEQLQAEEYDKKMNKR